MTDADETVRALEAGGIPPAAQRRLDELRAGGSTFFTSDLSTNEFLLIRRSGFRPLTQVMGSCFYNVGWQWLPIGSQSTLFGGGWAMRYAEGETVELETQTEAWNEARRLAIGRLAEEAKRAGADAVVGVRLQRGEFDWAAGVVEFIAVGTAVRSERYDLGSEPVLSNLDGQQFAALFEHGYWPAGFVAATTVAYVMSGWAQQFGTGGGFFSGLQNRELTDFSRGIYHARSQTMLRLNRQAHELGAQGVIGVDLQQEQHEYEREVNNTKYRDLILTMHVLGTAIVEIERPGEEPPVYVGLSLNEETR